MVAPAGGGAAVTVSVVSRAAAADRGGNPYQQRHADTDRYRGGDAADREAAPAESGAAERRIATGSR